MVYANESSPYAQAQHAAVVYKSGAYSADAGAYQSGAYTDQLSRYASAYAAPTLVTNDNLNALAVPYAGGYIVKVATVRAGSSYVPDDTQKIEDLEQEVRVGNALKAGAYTIFNVGGPIGDYTASNYQSAYVDGTWLAEASKQTGVKFF